MGDSSSSAQPTGKSTASDPRAPSPSAGSVAQPHSSHTEEERPHLIHFPQRMRDGQRVSDLPDDVPPAATSAASKPANAAAAHGIAQVLKPVAQRASSTTYPTAPGPPVSSQTTRLSEAPARRQLTSREVEAINLGGIC